MKLVEKKWWWGVVSASIVCLGMGMAGYRMLKGNAPLHFGIDFVGGTTMTLKFEALAEQKAAAGADRRAFEQASTQLIADVRRTLSTVGFTQAHIQMTQDSELVIKTTQHTPVQNHLVREALAKAFGRIEVIEVDYIGPSIGQELRTKSLVLIALVSVGLMAYITLRFEFAYGVGALASTLHDALLTIALASIFYIEIDTAFVAALLTILGYSINDTIVIFDRIRENLKGVNPRMVSLTQVVNQSIVQTMSRTINTVATVIIVLVALLVFGGQNLRAFCFTLLLGTLVGTYSSICIASPAMIMAYRKPIPSDNP